MQRSHNWKWLDLDLAIGPSLGPISATGGGCQVILENVSWFGDCYMTADVSRVQALAVHSWQVLVPGDTAVDATCGHGHDISYCIW